MTPDQLRDTIFGLCALFYAGLAVAALGGVLWFAFGRAMDSTPNFKIGARICHTCGHDFRRCSCTWGPQRAADADYSRKR